jgi:hypothetical protein
MATGTVRGCIVQKTRAPKGKGNAKLPKEFKFLREDKGNCRVYYRRKITLFCIQDDGYFGHDEYNFYICSKDGEPSHKVKFPAESRFDKLIYP